MENELITPECLTAELGMLEQLDATVDRSYGQFMRLKAARKKTPSKLSDSPFLRHRRLLAK